MKASMEASMEAFMEAIVEASVEATCTEFFRGSFDGRYFHGSFRENFHGS